MMANIQHASCGASCCTPAMTGVGQDKLSHPVFLYGGAGNGGG